MHGNSSCKVIRTCPVCSLACTSPTTQRMLQLSCCWNQVHPFQDDLQLHSSCPWIDHLGVRFLATPVGGTFVFCVCVSLSKLCVCLWVSYVSSSAALLLRHLMKTPTITCAQTRTCFPVGWAWGYDGVGMILTLPLTFGQFLWPWASYTADVKTHRWSVFCLNSKYVFLIKFRF